MFKHLVEYIALCVCFVYFMAINEGFISFFFSGILNMILDIFDIPMFVFEAYN